MRDAPARSRPREAPTAHAVCLGLGAMELTLVTLLLLVALGVVAGTLGSLVGIGGGLLLVPALSLGLGVDLRDAVAVSLVSVIATSTTSGSVYVAEGLANMRLGMTLEIATSLGGMLGGLAAIAISPRVLSGIFGVVLVVSAVLLVRARDPEGKASGKREPEREAVRGWEEHGKLAGAYYDRFAGKMVHYQAERLGLGSAIALLAGAISGMLGVGGGFVKVPAMTLGMRVPMRVAAATSNFMIGVTALASLTVYLVRGHVRPLLAAPLVVGVVIGALVGARASHHVPSRALRALLSVVLVVVAVEMGLRAFGASLV